MFKSKPWDVSLGLAFMFESKPWDASLGLEPSLRAGSFSP